jgi:CRISPR-associated endonuclease/helicase Cas3
LIVGSVAESVLCRLGQSIRELAPDGASTLAAVHDIGKISPGFQIKTPVWDAIEVANRSVLEGNHAKIGQAWLDSLPDMRGADGRSLPWILAVGGHHGRYLARAKLGSRRCFEGEEKWPSHLRSELLAELETAFGTLPMREISKDCPLLHWQTGFITFADWIGSNLDWFPLGEVQTLQNRWTRDSAQQAADEALESLGWHRREAKRKLKFGDLFSSLPDGTPFSPRPLQQVVIDAFDAPGLYLVEAPMGMGKTEAALSAAYRRWTQGGERGLYFALPTQLTSNSIHERVADFLDRAIHDDGAIQTLIHGNAWLHPDQVRPLQPTVGKVSNEDAGAVDAHLWFASSRKALLAPFGTGTIDQALMATMAVKHSALRLFGLSGKVVIIDEVHSYDAYTSALVDSLVEHLLGVGCSVIVLSATLTNRRRRELIAAAGAGEPKKMPQNYPLVTRVRTGAETAEPIAVEGEKDASVDVCLSDGISEGPECWAEIAEAAEAGACVLVIRNTVRSAQETFRAIGGALRAGTGVKTGLIHSRFTHRDRHFNESRWMKRLGRDDSERPRKGAVLVATQVVEQSVDIDADFLFTDPAPVDLILQRLGRLHRHRRENRPSGFTEPACRILWPVIDWNASAREIREAIGPSAWVYPPFSLYQAERLLQKRESIVLPDDIRSVLEASEEVPSELPAGAAVAKEMLDQEVTKMLSSAARERWDRNVPLEDIEGLQTRWGDRPTGLLVVLERAPVKRSGRIDIATVDGRSHSIIPGEFSYTLAKSLHECAIRVPWYLIRELVPLQERWLADHVEDAVIAWGQADSLELELFRMDEAPYRLLYSCGEGLRYERIRFDRTSVDPGEDFWY